MARSSRPAELADGAVLVLNGPSSAGKTTVAAAVQDLLAARGELWMVIGIDEYLAKVPAPWVRYLDHVGPRAGDGIGFERVGDHISFRCGPAGRRVLAAYRAAVSAVARSGINVIVDEVLLEDDGWQRWERQLEGLDVTWVSVDCDLALREERERQRGDRMIGISRAVAGIVHRNVVYDVAVDTSAAGPAACAEAIVGRLDQRRSSG